MGTEQDPLGPAGLGDARARRRGLGTRGRVALVVIGVMAVASGAIAVVRVGHRTDVPGQSAGSVTPGTAERTAGAADEQVRDARVRDARTVWPEAVASLPKTSADGLGYRPVTALGPTEILLTAGPSFEEPNRFDVYDMKTGRSRTLVTLVPEADGYVQGGVEVGEDYIAWYGRRPKEPRSWVDFWVAPRQGGDPIRVGEVTGELAGIDRFGVSADHVVWSPEAGGVYRMPIGGGKPEKMSETEGLWLASWPWARNVPAASDIETGLPDTNQNVLADLRTGVRQNMIPLPDVTGLRCSTEWCVGRQGGGAVAVRVDGRDLSRVPGTMTEPEVYGGRFVEVYRDTTSMIYDLATGKAGGITAPSPDGKSGSYGQGASSSPTQVFFWEAKPGDDYDVLNLAAIPELE
ncbi:hypothetical protein [Microtetraspora malaysiensis]|uniref:hypothetical protein n=1 Tax=Microtetraspora malaysiensis TaxID=161358 RepID=UPI00082B4FC6|nr:hypothetical protein [Microtetraspora malaysiensis]